MNIFNASCMMCVLFLLAACRNDNPVGQAANLKDRITSIQLDTVAVAEAFGVAPNAVRLKERSDSLTRTLFFGWIGEDSAKVSFVVNFQTPKNVVKDSLTSFLNKIESLKTNKGFEPVAGVGSQAAYGRLSPVVESLVFRVEESFFVNLQYMERGKKVSQLKQQEGNRRETLIKIAKILVEKI